MPNSQSFVGSNSSHTSGDLYTIDRRFNLAIFAQVRNKRMVDVISSILFLLLFPVTLLFVKKRGQFINNCFSVITGKKTWVGYLQENIPHFLPKIKDGIVPTYNILENFEPTEKVKTQLNIIYAQQYTPGSDLQLMLKNFKYLGGFQKKILPKG